MIRLLSALMFCAHAAFALSISPQDALLIGEKIWKNECNSSKKKLTHWNVGENFASLGIGHFIWYHKNEPKKFQETFPDLLRFLKDHGTSLPSWLKESEACPWDSHENFFENIHSTQMQELRELLYKTRDLQALFIAQRLDPTLQEILEHCSKSDKNHIAKAFDSLSKSGKGLYAMIDYLNFKGAGTSPTERYQGEGWGLLQVLQSMPSSSKSPLEDFTAAAKNVLKTRVQNAPPERNESRWLQGWTNRLNTYL